MYAARFRRNSQWTDHVCFRYMSSESKIQHISAVFEDFWFNLVRKFKLHPVISADEELFLVFFIKDLFKNAVLDLTLN